MRHLGSCESCRQYSRALDNLPSLLLADEQVPAPPRFVTSVMSRLAPAPNVRYPSRAAWRSRATRRATGVAFLTLLASSLVTGYTIVQYFPSLQGPLALTIAILVAATDLAATAITVFDLARTLLPLVAAGELSHFSNNAMTVAAAAIAGWAILVRLRGDPRQAAR